MRISMSAQSQGLRATGPGVDGDEGVPAIKRPVEKLAEFKGGDILFELRVLLIDFAPGVHVARFFREFDESVEVSRTLLQILERSDFFLMTFVAR